MHGRLQVATGRLNLPPHFDIPKRQRNQQHLDLLRLRGKREQEAEDVIDTLDTMLVIMSFKKIQRLIP